MFSQMQEMLSLRMTKYKSGLYVPELIYIVMFVTLFFQSSISTYIHPFFAISDEIFSLLGLCSILNKLNRRKIIYRNRYLKTIFKLTSLLVIIGWISTFFSGLQNSLIINLTDCFTCLKFFFVFYYSFILLNRCRAVKIVNITYSIISFYLILGVIFYILSITLNLDMVNEVRYGLRSYQFINSNPGDYASILIISLAMIHIKMAIDQKMHIGIRCIAIFLIFMTLRGKSLGLLATYIALLTLFNFTKTLSLKAMILLCLFSLVGAFSQIKYYFVDNVTPRALFLVNGIVTANDYFPFGSGYSTFGSNMAKVHYSELYKRYGFDNIWGMNEEEQQFLNDNFWPMIAGQFGWFGVILFVCVLFVLFNIVSHNVVSKQLKLAGFTLFFLLLYSSAGGPIFVHYIGCATIIVYSLVITLQDKMRTNEKYLYC